MYSEMETVENQEKHLLGSFFSSLSVVSTLPEMKGFALESESKALKQTAMWRTPDAMLNLIH